MRGGARFLAIYIYIYINKVPFLLKAHNATYIKTNSPWNIDVIRKMLHEKFKFLLKVKIKIINFRAKSRKLHFVIHHGAVKDTT